jgi:hypothetical protein
MCRKLVLSGGIATWLLIAPHAAHAYIGPGAGITAIGAVLGLLGALGLAVAGLVWYPIKRLRAKRRDKRARFLTQDSA